MSINPELTAAIEISRLLRYSGALEIDSFSKGAADLIKVYVPETSPIAGKAVASTAEQVPNHMVGAILTTLFCCLIGGRHRD